MDKTYRLRRARRTIRYAVRSLLRCRGSQQIEKVLADCQRALACLREHGEMAPLPIAAHCSAPARHEASLLCGWWRPRKLV